MAELKVISPGLFASIQDAGRFGFRRFGVPWSGVLNPEAASLANALLGNPLELAVVEFFQGGLSLRLTHGVTRLAVVGDCLLKLQRSGKQRIFRAGRSVVLQPGDILEIGRVYSGKVGYLAVDGGFDLPPVMGSRSTYLRAGFGGLNGDLLRVGSVLPVVGDQETGGNRYLPAEIKREDYDQSLRDARLPKTIRLIMGPQDDYFTEAALRLLCSEIFCISHDSDRMGCRLLGPHLEHNSVKGAEIISDGLIPGAIQVPGSGEPIVMLADGPTVGGYPKIATLISADLPALATMMPGEELRFAAVTQEEAEEILRSARAAFSGRLGSLEMVPESCEPFARLHDCTTER